MRSKLPLRVSSIILFLFAAGHTAGFLSFHPDSPKALEVMEAMRTVPFTFGSTTAHWMDFYRGFGLSVSVSGFFSAIVAWCLSSARLSEKRLALVISWLLCLTQVASIVLSACYFSVVQASFSVVSFAALLWSALALNAELKASGESRSH